MSNEVFNHSPLALSLSRFQSRREHLVDTPSSASHTLSRQQILSETDSSLHCSESDSVNVYLPTLPLTMMRRLVWLAPCSSNKDDENSEMSENMLKRRKRQMESLFI